MAEFQAINFHSLITQVMKEQIEFSPTPSSLPLQLKLAEFSSLAKAVMHRGHLDLIQKLDSKDLEVFIEILVKTKFGAITEVLQTESPSLKNLEALQMIQIDQGNKISLHSSKLMEIFLLTSTGKGSVQLSLIK